MREGREEEKMDGGRKFIHLGRTTKRESPLKRQYEDTPARDQA
jgi:hypothetical protein